MTRDSTGAAREDDSSRERRTGADRRRRPTPMLSRYTFRGRRRGPRRASDPQWNYYVDRPRKRDWAMALTLFVLSAFDAFFTLYLLGRGAYEVNPVMRTVLGYGHSVFLGVKYSLTLLAVLVLLLHANFYLWRPLLSVRRMAGILLVFYLCVVIYQVTLIL
ncbi:MAG: DUF5658 family protein [candidate division KSB1 bacterium]|nr:DUF5658 family protein [candidate division KSB1 bacterium]